MAKIEHTQLLIAGGGPVGLVAALCAAKRGLDLIVIERSFRGTPRGHTTLLHPSSIRLLAELGLAPLLLRAGQLLERLELRVNSDIVQLTLPFPALAITQALLEETLLQVLRKEEVELRATSEVTGISQSERNVEVKVVRREQLRAASSTQEERWELADSSSVQAEFVIGADGRSSRVRESLEIGTMTRPLERYAMFEFPTDDPPEPTLVIRGGFCHSMTPLPEGRARASFQLAPGTQPIANLLLLATLLRERAPQQETPRELYWSGVVDFEPALAEAFGRNRVCLAGDAAHTTSPIGVQSMNRGFAEVCQMVEAMAAVNAGKRPLAALELLGRAHHHDWLRTFDADAHFELLPHAPSWLAGHAGRVVSALPVSGPDLEDLLGQLGIARRSQVRASETIAEDEPSHTMAASSESS